MAICRQRAKKRESDKLMDSKLDVDMMDTVTEEELMRQTHRVRSKEFTTALKQPIIFLLQHRKLCNKTIKVQDAIIYLLLY